MLQTAGTKDLQEAVNDFLYPRWPVNMNICRARIAPGPCSHLEEGDDVRDMVGVEVGKHDMLQLVMLYACLQEALEDAVPTVKEDIGVVQIE